MFQTHIFFVCFENAPIFENTRRPAYPTPRGGACLDAHPSVAQLLTSFGSSAPVGSGRPLLFSLFYCLPQKQQRSSNNSLCVEMCQNQYPCTPRSTKRLAKYAKAIKATPMRPSRKTMQAVRKSGRRLDIQRRQQMLAEEAAKRQTRAKSEPILSPMEKAMKRPERPLERIAATIRFRSDVLDRMMAVYYERIAAEVEEKIEQELRDDVVKQAPGAPRRRFRPADWKRNRPTRPENDDF
ncbi:unnamed protein product [Caenorhabditis auriculariae]|uniref:Uncharacterized protein n=1 Tax=Caenorhabditis auriculariae TaxID=2777116 RepID=A0A8S1GUD8_9PELO|nr:unnamed protein product [Caenorhabditis auriculariae]